MELYKEILIKVLKKEPVVVSFPDLAADVREVTEMACYQALRKIREILDEENLDDAECFGRIEKIDRLFEDMGSDGGTRHDFG